MFTNTTKNHIHKLSPCEIIFWICSFTTSEKMQLIILLQLLLSTNCMTWCVSSNFRRGNFCTTNPIIAKVSSPLLILDSTSFGERMLEFKSFGRPLLSAERFIFGKSNLSSLEISKLIMSKSSKSSLPSGDEPESGKSKDLI